MIWQTDAMEVEEVISAVPRSEDVEFDLEHHLATVKYIGPDALEEILTRLAEAGYPAANA